MNKLWVIIGIVVIALLGAGIAIAQKKGVGPLSAPAEVSAPLQVLLDNINQAQGSNDKLALKEAYSQIITQHPDYEKVEEIQNKLGSLNIDLIFSKQQTPQTVTHEVQVGDSLGKLAKQYGTTKELISRKNNLKSDVIRVGQKLVIWKAPFSIFVDKSQNVLLLSSEGEVVKTYQCSTGKDNSTPVGTFTIANKIPKPVWFKTGAAPIPSESPDNELGSRWMGFGEDPHYGIHGTIKPNEIGSQATAGCVRLTNNEVEELFDIVPAGTKVTIQD